MATADARGETLDIFQTVERQIREAFDDLIVRITNRRDGFLEEIRNLNLAFQEKIKSQTKTLEDLENIRIQLQTVSQKENTTSNILQLTLAPMEQQISDLKDSLIQPPDLCFSCQTQRIYEMIGDLGKLDYKGKPVDYTNKYKAVDLIEVKEVGSFHSDGICLHIIVSNNIYVYDATNWKLLKTHCLNNNIQAMATTKNYFYLLTRTYNQNEIIKLTRDTFQTVKRQHDTGGSYSKPLTFTSIAIASEDEIYVADRDNNRICVFDSNLYFRREFGTETLQSPTVVIIKGNRVIVKDKSKEFLLFNLRGDYIQNLSGYGDVSVVTFFCFDSADNLIFSRNNSVRIISPKGEQLKVIGSEVTGCEDVKGCGPIALYRDKIIVACSALDCIKIF